MLNNFGENLRATDSNIDRNNRIFAIALTIAMCILGSISTIMIISAFAIVLMLQMKGFVRTEIDREIWLVALFFTLFFAAGVLQAILHFDGGENIKVIVKRLPFLAIIPLIVIMITSSKEVIKTNLETGAAIGAFLAMIYTIYEIQTGAQRTEVGSGNPGPFATSLSLALTLCLLGLMRSKYNKRTLFMLMGIIAATICVVTSGVRTLWPLLIILPIIALWGIGRYRNIVVNRYYLAGILIFIILAYFLLGNLITSRIELLFYNINQVVNAGEYQNSLGTRLLMWEYSWKVIPEAYWVGIGQYQSITDLTNFLENEHGNQTKYTHFHNFIINAVVRGGIVDLVATLGLLVGPIAVVWKYRDNESCRYGITLMLATSTILATSGMLNIAFGHDIHDSLFTYFMAIGTWIVLGKEDTSFNNSE